MKFIQINEKMGFGSWGHFPREGLWKTNREWKLDRYFRWTRFEKHAKVKEECGCVR